MKQGTELAEGLKFDSGKNDWSLVPWSAMDEVVSVLTFGDNKYNPEDSNPENWQRVKDADKRYFSATMRHLLSRLQGVQLDQETGRHAIAHAICDLLFILQLDLEAEQACAPTPSTRLSHYQAHLIGAVIERELGNTAAENHTAELMNNASNSESTAA